MRTHAIIGAGQVGRRLARSLIGNGESVRLVSRRGTSLDGARVISADAADRESLLAATTGADVIYNCVNPAYHSWQEEWPPIANNLIEAAEHADAVLVTLSNLYGYGPVDHAMTEEMPRQVTPVRALCERTCGIRHSRLPRPVASAPRRSAPATTSAKPAVRPTSATG